jgi:3-deoxy-D-manno-octulosonic-acid transferase
MGLDPTFRAELIQRTRHWKSVPRQTGCLWVHASSVGEVRVAELLIQSLQQRYPDRTVVLSTFTATGYALAKEVLECPVFRLPLDLPFLICPLLKRLDPAILILIEAEYWPNLLHACSQRKIPVLLANGRLSVKSFTRYQKLKFWFRWITEPISIFSMRGQAEAERLLKLDIDPARVQITGNMKFDRLSTDEILPPKLTQMGEITVVFGSTRPGEESAIAKAISQFSQNPLDYRFIIAPRHVPRCREVESILRSAGLSVTLHSDRKDPSERWTTTVLLVDALGMLNDYYRQGHVAFVGGGFDPRHGGHNILEPAIFGLPVIYGKDMGNFEEEARLLSDSGGGIQIEHPEDLTPVLEKLLSDPEEILRRGALAAEAVQRQKGAVNRNLELVQSLIEKGNAT